MNYTDTYTQSLQASHQQRCPLCERGHYCYLIKNDLGEIYKVLCQWTDANNPPQEWKCTGTAKDGRPIFVNSALAPKRRRSKKYPAVIKFHLKEREIPQWQKVEVPVTQAYTGHTVRLKPDCPGGSQTLYIIDSIHHSPKNGLLAKLKRKDSGFNGKLEVPFSDITEVVTRDPSTGAQEIFIEYQYSSTQKVIRKQWSDRRKAYKGSKNKEVLPYHLVGDSWVCGKGEQECPLYREDEAQAEIESGGILFAPAGEQAVEAIRWLGLTATCNQGGEGGMPQIAKRLAESFAEASAIDKADEVEGLTKGLKPLLIIWGDNDEVGRISAQKLQKACYREKITTITIDPLLVWADMPHKGDAHDWLEHCKKSGISFEEMIHRLEFAVDVAIEQEEEDAQSVDRKLLSVNARMRVWGDVLGTGSSDRLP
jgi:hypothetical protein